MPPRAGVRARTVRASAAVCAALFAACLPSVAPAQELDDTVEGFHAALERGDSTAALSFLDPDVTIYESGHAESLEEYRSGHLAADIEFAQATESTLLSSWTSDSEAVGAEAGTVVLGRVYRTRGTFREREIDAVTTETMVLHRLDGVLRIRHIHWSSRRATPSD
jgi:ketosteroid isomerase-like protein